MNVVPPIEGIDRGFYGHHSRRRAERRYAQHFEAQQFVENATPGFKNTGTGWVGRHLASVGQSDALLPAIAAGGSLPSTLAGAPEAVSISAIDDFGLRADPLQVAALRRLYEGNSWLHASGAQTFRAIETIRRAGSSGYHPANGASYPDGSFGNKLKSVARLIKLGVGLRAATVDLSGWDTHQGQGDGAGGYLANLVDELSDGLLKRPLCSRAALLVPLNGGLEQLAERRGIGVGQALEVQAALANGVLAQVVQERLQLFDVAG